MFSVSAEFKNIYVLFKHLVQLNLLILWTEPYNFLKENFLPFVKVNYVV